MPGYKKHIDEAYLDDAGYDVENGRQIAKRAKASYLAPPDDIKMGKYPHQRSRRTVKEYIDTVATKQKHRHNVYLYEEPRMMSRNGLTPRTELMQPIVEKELYADKHDIGDTTENNNAKAEVISAPSYSCNFCGARFSIKSLLGAHRRTHDDDFKARYNPKRTFSSALPANVNQCKFCDRKFDLERTLHIHQMCHCKKIPPAQRRKLGYTELLHEKKAPLPAIFHKQMSLNDEKSYKQMV